MSILDIAEDAVGAFAADKALEMVDPNAGFLAKAAAAVVGFEGVAKVKDMMSQHNEAEEAQPSADDQMSDGQA